MELNTAAQIVAAANAGNMDRCRLIAGRHGVLAAIQEARDLVEAPEFRILKPARVAGFYVFEDMAEEAVAVLPTRKKAQIWIDEQIAERIELIEKAISAAEIEAANRATQIAAARAAAPVQMEMFA